eukprot:5520295-Lingulodinium_polyedra.AAC.1
MGIVAGVAMRGPFLAVLCFTSIVMLVGIAILLSTRVAPVARCKSGPSGVLPTFWRRSGAVA